MPTKKPMVLIILDGWGYRENEESNAIFHANTPVIDDLMARYPNMLIGTSGMAVGLPEGQMGNSEVGHMNLGAGRIVYQDLVKINLAVQKNTLQNESVLINAFEYAKTNNKPVHFLGLVSDGGVHSHISHLFGLIKAANKFGVQNSFVHAFTDGRDVDPKSGYGYITELMDRTKNTNTKLASVTGRYYAMDRDNRWDRIKLAYDAMVNGIGNKTNNILKSIHNSYDENITDEFINPFICTNENNEPIAQIKNGDVVIFFNFRTDRGRELTEALTQKDFHEQNMHKLNLHYVTMTNYDESFKNIHVIFKKDNLKDTLGEVLAKNNKKQIRIAETEKYPHVTFFFSGGQEEPFEGEKRILRNSPKVATYDLKPEMSAFELRDALIPELEKGDSDFICLNFANGDMVGHTGDMDAAIKACEAVDQCVNDVINTALKNDYTTLLIADHGNCETMINPDGTPHTAHTTNPVPIILIDKNLNQINDGILGDLAPTILKLIGIEKPAIMNQKSLI